MPILASQARDIGMVDKVFPEDWELYHQTLQLECEAMAKNEIFFPLLAQKNARRIADENAQPLETYRAMELRKMKAIFDNADSEYHSLRYNFVYKVSCGRTPARLIYMAPESQQLQTA
jgi:putative two-component system hydrogenase maturation factor HypX/HoxX